MYGVVNSTGLFKDGKTTFSIVLMGDDPTNGFVCKGYIQDKFNCGIATGDTSEYLDSVLIWATPIEIRVYN